MKNKFIPNDFQKAFASRVKQRRKALGMSRSDLARKMQEVDKEHREVKIWTVQGYERGHIPRDIQRLCEALSVEPNFLLSATHLGYVDWDRDCIFKNDGTMPLSPEELKYYGGLPVWVRPDDKRQLEYCAVVDDVHYAVTSPQHGSIPFDNIEGTVWVEPSYHRDDVLSRDEAEAACRVFIFPVRTSLDAKRKLSGWYNYDVAMKSFVAEDHSWIFSASQYGVSYIGFATEKTVS